MTLGIDVMRVQEVLAEQTVTDVPLSQAAVRGLINLRGQIVTVLDLSTCLKIPQDDLSQGSNIVVTSGEEAVSLQVDRVHDILDVDPAALEPSPTTLPAAVRNFVTAVYKLPQKLLLVLDVDAVIARLATEQPRQPLEPS